MRIELSPLMTSQFYVTPSFHRTHNTTSFDHNQNKRTPNRTRPESAKATDHATCRLFTANNTIMSADSKLTGACRLDYFQFHIQYGPVIRKPDIRKSGYKKGAGRVPAELLFVIT
jgi:hypothetical protein